MVDKKPSKQTDTKDFQSYTPVGIVFLVVGLSLLASEGTRLTGFPMIAVGITLLILGRQKPGESKRK